MIILVVTTFTIKAGELNLKGIQGNRVFVVIMLIHIFFARGIVTVNGDKATARASQNIHLKTCTDKDLQYK